MSTTHRTARALSGLLAGTGVVHFAAPGFYEPMIPAALPGTPHDWVIGSGVVELALAAAVAAPRTRRVGGLATAAFFVAIMPAHVKMSADSRRDKSRAFYLATLARMPLQIPLVLWALRASRETS